MYFRFVSIAKSLFPFHTSLIIDAVVKACFELDYKKLACKADVGNV